MQHTGLISGVISHASLLLLPPPRCRKKHAQAAPGNACSRSVHVSIGVNAAGVAGVTTPSPIFDLQGSSCVDDSQYFDKCFIFFPSAELLDTASRCHFSSAVRPVVTCGLTACTPGSSPGPTLGNEYGKTLPLPNAPSVQFLIQQLDKTAFE